MQGKGIELNHCELSLPLKIIKSEISLKKLHVLKGVNLTVKKGEVISIMGASGSEKSTLLYCTNALEPILGGQILVDGTDVHAKATGVNRLHQKIGMVF
jgi:ABC-type polar amino acid transport system ATPase subunit